jgi:hypothetical protein
MLSPEEHRFSREDLLTALEKGWRQYLPRLKELSDEEQARYAREQGFARIEDVIAHIFGWWELSMQRTFRILSGHDVPIANDMDEINAALVEQYQHWTRADIEERFTAALAAFEQFLIDLPEKALENDRVYLWLSIDAIDHYEAHRLPNGPALREAQR